MSRFARRRAALVAAVIVLISAVAIALASGSSKPAPLYQPQGLVSTTLSPVRPAPVSRSPNFSKLAPFTPSAAATAAAANLTLPQQVALLFVPEIPLGTADLYTQLAGAPWGGAIFTSADDPASATDGTASTDAYSAAAILRGLGDRAPLIGLVQPGGGAGALPSDPPIAQRRQAHDLSGQAAGTAATAAATLLTRLGFHLTLAPEADVGVPQGFLSTRMFGTDPRLVTRLAAAAVSAYTAAGFVAAPGHFPGQGSASADPDQMSATVGGGLSELKARDLVPFAALAKLAPIIQMSNASFAAFDGVTPATLLPAAVGLLRTQLRFRGVVLSGDLDAAAQTGNEDAGKAALQALAAGCDLLAISGSATERAGALQTVISAAGRQPVLASEIHESVLRVLTLKDRFGLLR